MTSTIEIDPMALIDVRDEVAVVRDLAVCLCLACSSPVLPRDERTALSQLAMIVRERLNAMAELLDRITAASATFTSGDGRF